MANKTPQELQAESQEQRKTTAESTATGTELRKKREEEGQFNIPLSSDPSIARGQVGGLETARALYGMDIGEIGQETRDITRRRRERLEGKDPATTRARERKAAQIRTAKAGGATAGQLTQIERQASSDIGQTEYRSQDKALSDYQKLIGNILGGTTSLEMGMAGLEKSGELVDYRGGSGGGLSDLTIICTELYNQGYMSDEIFGKDKEYGKLVRHTDPNVYIGYIFMARPFVKSMRKSPLFTKLISIPAMAWARDMAGEKSLFGKLINKVCTPICRIVGYVITFLNNLGVIYA